MHKMCSAEFQYCNKLSQYCISAIIHRQSALDVINRHFQSGRSHVTRHHAGPGAVFAIACKSALSRAVICAAILTGLSSSAELSSTAESSALRFPNTSSVVPCARVNHSTHTSAINTCGRRSRYLLN